MCGTNDAVTAGAHSMALGISDFRDLKAQRRKTEKF